MLYLDAPFHVIHGVVVFRDHQDPLQWYAMPGSPRLSTVTETVAGEDRQIPQLSLIKFKGTAGTGGFLNFDVDLAIGDDLRDEVVSELKQLEHLDGTPRLGHVPLLDGSIRLMLFDAATPVPAPPDAGGPPPPDPAPGALEFVLEIDHAAKPALYGDNRAAFSVQLSQQGVTILEKALHGELSPIGVVYQLDYLGLRPAYNVSVSVDWDRVQKHLDEHEEFSVPLVYLSSIDTVVDELIESRVIEITADLFVLEDDGSPVAARMEQALDDVRDMVTETFFEPSLDPIDRSDVADDVVRTAGRVSMAIASGGASEFSAFRRKSSDITRIDRKRLDVSMSERTTVKRTMYPQGHLSGLFRTLDLPGIGMDRFVTEVDLDDPWFERRTVEVISRADFARDQITSVAVELSYQGHPQGALLTAGHDTDSVSWPSVLSGGGMAREVTSQFTVNFGAVDSTERPRTLVSIPKPVTGDKLEVDPRDLYTLVGVPVLAVGFPWETYPAVEVELRYADPANGIAQADDLVLDATHTEVSWSMFVRDAAAPSFRYRLTYRAANQRDHVTGWIDSDRERVIVRDPFPSVRTVEIVPLLDWTVVDRVFADLRYADPANGVLEEQSFEFKAGAEDTRVFRVRLQDVTRREIGYQVTVFTKDHRMVKIPPSVTLDGRIALLADMRGHRIIGIRPGVTDFAAIKVRSITVDVRYVDAAHGLSVADRHTFRSGDDAFTFEYDYVDGGPVGYEFQVTTEFTNNLTRQQFWSPATGTELIVAPG